MTDDTDFQRRALLQSVAGIAAAQLAGAATAAPAAPPASSGKARAGDFDFLAGQWRIAHRRLRGPKEGWDTFEGEATCWTLLHGKGGIEELRIPARNFSGLGIRLLEDARGLWSDYWVNGRDCVLSTPGLTGTFADGVGTFVAEEIDDGKPLKVRGVWDRVTSSSCRWHQSVSRDGGVTWDYNWYMDWTRA